MSTAAGDAPAPRTPTPSVKERTVALESELLRHTEATTSGGERNSVPSGTSQGGEKVGPDTPPGGAPSGSMTRADANGVDEAAASPVVVNVALMHDHRPDASRASLNGGKPRGAEAVDSEAVGYSDRDAAAAAATKPTDGDQRRPTSPTPTRVRACSPPEPTDPRSRGGCDGCTSARAARGSPFPLAGDHSSLGSLYSFEGYRRCFHSYPSRASRR